MWAIRPQANCTTTPILHAWFEQYLEYVRFAGHLPYCLDSWRLISTPFVIGQNGKRIMMRVRVLEQENEELANANRTGRAAKLETEIALRRRFVQDLKQTYSDIEYLVEEVESETELFGSSLLMLQQRLSMAKITAQLFATELEALEPGRARALFEGATWSPFNSTTAESAQPADSLLQNVMAGDDSREVHRFEPTVPLPKVTSSSDFPPGPPDKGPAQPSHTSHGNNKKNHRSRTKHSTKRSKTSSHDQIETTPLGSQPDDREIITNKCRRTGESRCLPQRPANQIPITRPPIPVKGPQRTFDESRDTRDRCDRTPFDPHFPARRDIDTPIAASNSHPDKSPTNCYPLSDNSTTNDRASNGQLADDISAAQ